MGAFRSVRKRVPISSDSSDSSSSSSESSESSPEVPSRTPKHSKEIPVKMQAAKESDPLLKRNLELLESGNFADAEVVCNGRVWKVHKLILRSGCVWFEKAFANNWQEAQTGRINLREQQPEQINALLRFIYSGRLTPKVASKAQGISIPVLESSVCLWETADFFLLPNLKTEAHEYLLDRMTATIWFFHPDNLSQFTSNKNINVKRGLDIFFADFSGAVKKAHTCPTARELHKLFAIFFCALRRHIPEPILWEVMRTPGIQKDVSSALIALNFTHAAKGFVSDPATLRPLSHTARQLRCHACGKGYVRMAGLSPEEFWSMALDPFAVGYLRWCDACAFPRIKSLLKTMISEWPAESDQI